MKLSVMHVGFGGAILAGLLLAFIGHPGPTTLPIAASTAAASASPNAPRTFVLKSVSVELPSSDVAFPGPNAEAIADNCLACHSAGMVLTQPTLSKATWDGVVEKMIHTYKAPIGQNDIPAIVDYLAATRGVK
jgi:cytochrome c5